MSNTWRQLELELDDAADKHLDNKKKRMNTEINIERKKKTKKKKKK